MEGEVVFAFLRKFAKVLTWELSKYRYMADTSLFYFILFKYGTKTIVDIQNTL
jgi:hypothetical protein